jgi:hypothetical protein
VQSLAAKGLLSSIKMFKTYSITLILETLFKLGFFRKLKVREISPRCYYCLKTWQLGERVRP